MRWTIVKIDDLNQPIEGEQLEEGGEAQILVNLKRTNNSNSQTVTISNLVRYCVKPLDRAIACDQEGGFQTCYTKVVDRVPTRGL
jgi:hypothetical protein